jgi:hypothetical protein
MEIYKLCREFYALQYVFRDYFDKTMPFVYLRSLWMVSRNGKLKKYLEVDTFKFAHSTFITSLIFKRHLPTIDKRR